MHQEYSPLEHIIMNSRHRFFAINVNTIVRERASLLRQAAFVQLVKKDS